MALKDHRRKLVSMDPAKAENSPVSSGIHSQEAPVEQLSFSENNAVGVMDVPPTSAVTPAKEVQTGEINLKAVAPLEIQRPPVASREPVLIPATGKKSTSIRPPQGRRIVINSAVSVILCMIVCGTLAAVVPVDTQGKTVLGSIFSPTSSFSQVKKNEAALIASQAATATAVTQGGYDAGNGVTYEGVNTNITPQAVQNVAPKPSGAYGNEPYSNHFTAGQCTFWAAARYHELRGYNIPWSGNAGDWPWAAKAYPGWVVTQTPVVGSIISLSPGVQYAGPYGHVAIVERINPDGSLYTSNWNVKGWGVLSYETYWPGGGVYFIYHV